MMHTRFLLLVTAPTRGEPDVWVTHSDGDLVPVHSIKVWDDVAGELVG